MFFDQSHALRPYVGVGMNYTSFYDRDSTAAATYVSFGPQALIVAAGYSF